MSEHEFAKYVRILGKGKKSSRSLSEEEACTALTLILEHKVEPVQLGAFMMLLRVKEESPEELVGFIKATRRHLNAFFPSDFPSQVDWPSYSGKHKHHPWYLLAALALADQGIKIFMHGAAGHTQGRLYSEEVLAQLGIPISSTVAAAAVDIEKNNFAFSPLRTFCPVLHDIIDLRNTLGLRSPVHTLVRLLNPSQSAHLVTGIFHPSYRPLHQQAGLQLGYPSMAVFKGEAGEAERKPDARCLVQAINNGRLMDEEWPALMRERQAKAQSLTVPHLAEFWQGKVNDDYGEQAVIGTMAIILKQINQYENQADAMEAAQEYWAQRNLSTIS